MADENVVEEEAETPAATESESAITPTELDKPLAPPKYEVRPSLGEKFQSQNVREIIVTTMQEQLMGRKYRSDQAPRWTEEIANRVRQRVQDLDMKRYKILVQCIMIEMKGAGVKCAQRCMWDPETDDYVGDLFRNETIYCYTVAYGIYMY
ncbi:dynein light chain Tctex-type protein 2B [Bombyx mori]|uniref:Dynein light chain n=1 Tax=Bombyx mori TaxID=7091 RepID=A0A8R2M0R0_BOMMO|nr:tctex1 domain-containing protein 2 [Bombyx mori]